MRRLAAAAVAAILLPTSAGAQPHSAANQGAIAVAASVDLPSTYFFRGIRQEGDAKLTVQPSGTVTAAIGGAHARRVAIEAGLWESLHTGTAGSGGPARRLQYEEDFFAAVTAGVGRGLRARAAFVAYTSPNGSFDAIKDVELRLGDAGPFAPYALVALELSDRGQRDNGSRRGTYLEVGAQPRRALRSGRVSVSVPLKAGFSLRDYYEVFGSDLTYRDRRFGFFQAGGRVTVPISGEASRFGRWELHGGADVLRLGANTQMLNRGNKHAAVATAGVGLTY